MILYGSSFSPYVRKVLVYVAERGLDVTNHPTSLREAPPEFYAASPFKKMPAFSDGDFSISDSTAIITYLDCKFAEKGMLPPDPAARARVVWFEEFADTILSQIVFKCFFNRIVAPKFLGRAGDEKSALEGETVDFPPMLDYLESVVPAAGSFLVGEQLTVADISVASIFVNLLHARVAYDADTYPKTRAWVQAMHARPSFATIIAREAATLAKIP